MLLAIVMVFSMLPLNALAVESYDDHDCTHHVHSDECGYVEAVAGADCTHVHDDVCGYVEAVEEVLCECTETDEAGALIHTEGCGYVAPVAGSDCTHEHDDTCGYVEAVEGVACAYDCEDCAEEAAAAAAVAEVQAMIDALSTEVPTSEEEYAALEAAILAVDVAMAELTSEQLGQLDYTNYSAAKDALADYAGEDYSAEVLVDPDGNWYWDNDTLYIKDGSITNVQLYVALNLWYNTNNEEIRYGTCKDCANSGTCWTHNISPSVTTVNSSTSGSVTLGRGTHYAKDKRYGSYTEWLSTKYGYKYDLGEVNDFVVEYYYVPTVSVKNEDGTAASVSATVTTSKVYTGGTAIFTLPKMDTAGWSAVVTTAGDIASQTVALSTEGATTINVEGINSSSDATITVTLKQATSYNITVSVAGDCTGWGTASASAISSIAGETITITATPTTNTYDATYAFAGISVNNGEVENKLTFTMPEEAVEVVAYFTKTGLEAKDSATDVKYNGYYADGTQMSTDALNALKEAIFDGLNVTSLPEGATCENVTYQYFPWYTTAASGSDYSDENSLADLNGTKEDFSVDLGFATIGYTFSEFGQRGFTNGAFTGCTEKVRISYTIDGTTYYVDGYVTLTEGRPDAFAVKDSYTLTTVDVEDDDAIIAQAKLALEAWEGDLSADADEVTYSIGTKPTAEGEGTVVVTVSVAAGTADYKPTTGKTVNVPVKVEAKAATLTVNNDSNKGTVVLTGTNGEVTDSSYKDTLTVTVTPYSGYYVTKIIVNNAEQTFGYNGTAGVVEITYAVENGKSYTFAVEYGDSITVNETNGTDALSNKYVVPFNGYYSAAEQSGLGTAIFNVLVNTGEVVHNDKTYTVEVYDSGYFSGWRELSVFTDAAAYLGAAFNANSTRKVRLSWDATAMHPAYSLEFDNVYFKESRKVPTIAVGSYGDSHDGEDAFKKAVFETLSVVENGTSTSIKTDTGVTVDNMTLELVSGSTNEYYVKLVFPKDGKSWLASTDGVYAYKNDGTTKQTVTYKVSTYKVTFKDWNGKTLSEVEYPYGTTADKITAPSVADEMFYDEAGNLMYTYTFAAWDPTVATVTGEATYTATYNKVMAKYIITWVNGDETTYSENVAYSATAGELTAMAPAASKASTAQYDFTNGTWGTLAMVTGDATYTATFTEELRSYTITWVNGDETTYSYDVDYGTTAEDLADLAPAASKTSTAQYHFINGTWGTLAMVTGDATYTAIFTEDLRSYTITWIIKGEETTETKYYGYQITHNDLEGYTTEDAVYTFKGWKVGDSETVINGTDLPKLTSDVTITAMFSANPVYQVTVDPDDGTGTASTPVENGETFEVPAAPTKSGYRFMGWYVGETKYESGTVLTITEATTITAKWSELFTVTWKNANGSVLKTETDKYIAGETPEYKGSTPTQDATAQYTYSFAGWEPEVGAIEGDTTYTAVYSSTVNQYTVTFTDENGNVLDKQTLYYGDTPVYGGTTPTKDYYFWAWDTEIATVTGNATYKLVWTPNNDTNKNSVADELETITVVIGGDGTGSVTINGTIVKNGDSYIYDNTTNSNVVVATPDVSNATNGSASYCSTINLNNASGVQTYDGSVASATVAFTNGDTLNVNFVAYTLAITGGKDVGINKYYTANSNSAALTTLRTDILKALGLDPNGDYVVTTTVGIQSLGDWATWTVEVKDGDAVVVKGTDWLYSQGYLANELNKASYSFTVALPEKGGVAVSKTVSLNMVDSRKVVDPQTITVSEQKDLGYMTNDNIQADVKKAVGNLSLGTPSISAGALPVNAGDLTSVTYTVKFEGDATYQSADITITYENVYKAYNDCTVSADSSLTANGSMTINGGTDATVPGNSTVTITVKPISDKIVESITVTNKTTGEAVTVSEITYSSQAATVTFTSDGATAADEYVVSATYSDKYLNLVTGTIVYCVDDKDHTYDLQKLVFEAIFIGSCAPMTKDNVKLEYQYAGGDLIKLWADVSKDPSINIDGISHKFGEDGSETIKLTYSDDKYGSFEQQIELNVFDSCYSVTVGVNTVTNGANATIKTQYSADTREYLNVNYFKAGTELTVTLTPDGEILDVLAQMYNGTYAEKMAYIKSVSVTDKNGDAVEATLTRGQGKLSLDSILSGVNPLLFNAAVTFTLEADEQYTVTVEYGIHELPEANDVQLPMYQGGKDYAAEVPTTEELINAILGEDEAAAFLATYGGAYTVEFTNALLANEWTAVSDEALLALSDGSKITVRITWKPGDTNMIYYPVATTAEVTLVDLRTYTSVQGSFPEKQVNFISEDKLIAELKEKMDLGILANGSALDVNYSVTYTLKEVKETVETTDETTGETVTTEVTKFYADVTVSYDGSAEYKPTSKTFENVPVANRPDDATIKVTIQNASDVVTNNDGKIQTLDTTTSTYTVIGNGTYNFKFTPAPGYAIEKVVITVAEIETGIATAAEEVVELIYDDQTASFEFYMDEKHHYEVVVETVSSVWGLEEEPTYDFATGVMTPDNSDMVEAVTTYPTDIDFEKVTVEYLARAEGKVTVSLPDIDLGFTVIELGTFDVDLGELWLNPEVSVNMVSEDQLDKILENLVDDIIYQVSMGELDATKAFDYIQTYVKNLPLGIHAFGVNGDGSTETIRFSYEDDKYLLAQVQTDVTIHDYRIATEIEAVDCEVTFGYSLEQLIAASGAQVLADGVVVNGLTIKTDDLYLHANTEAQEITLYFAGDVTYQPSKVTINVIVNKATATVDYDSQMITYGDEYEFALSVSPTVMPNGTNAEIDLVEFMIGLDMHTLLDVDIEDKTVGINEAIAYIQLRLPASIRNLPLVGQYLQGEFTLGEFTDLINSLSDVLGIDEESMGTLNQVVEAITGITDSLEIKIIVKDEDFHPTNVGVYIAGAVTVDADFETAYTADYLIIAPKTIEAELAWDYDYTDPNGVTTLPTFQSDWVEEGKLGAHVVENDVMTGDLLDTANSHVKYLVLGINDETSEFLTTDVYGNIKANIWTSNEAISDNGAYVQIAYMLNWGNEIYYAVPIVRSFLITPEAVNVEFVGYDGEENRELVKEFNNQPHGFGVKIYSFGELIYSDHYQDTVNNLPEGAELTVTYVGIQSNGQVYNSNEKPVHAGVYTAMATYIYFDENGDLQSVGADAGVLVITPTESTVDVENSLDNVVNGDVGHKPVDMVTAGSTVENLTPDTTIISAGIGSNGTYSENGWDAILGTVNVDFPVWVDELLNKYAPSIVDGIEVGALADKLTEKLPEIVAALEAEGATSEVLNSLTNAIENVVALLEKMPEDAIVSFTDDIAYVNVGVYAVVAIVTDSDHYPSMDAGLLVIRPEVHSVELQWNYEDENYVWTRELLKYVDWMASAYENGVYSETGTALVENQFIGIDAYGNMQFYTNPSNMPNGAYVNVAYIPLELDGVMYISNLIARPMVIIPSNVTVELVGGSGTSNNELLKEFNNEQQGFNVKVYDASGELIYSDHYQTAVNNLPENAELTIHYYGVQTNGTVYDSDEKPVHAGAYTVLVTYVDYDEDGYVVAYGATAGVLVIEPTTSEIEVSDVVIKHEDKTATTHSFEDILDIKASSTVENLTPDVTVIVGSIATTGDFSENGWDAVTGTVNVDFPDWVDAILTEYAPSIYNGMTVGEFSAKILSKLPEIEEALLEAEISATVTDALIGAMEVVAETLGKLPEDVVLTFNETNTLTAQGIGAYVVIGVVTDSDHYPSVDAGIVAIVPDVDQVFLKWDYEDTNGIFTHEMLQYPELLWATAYDDAEFEYEYDDKEYVITYQFIGVDAYGNLIVTENASDLVNGAYIELAYIEFEVAGEMVISDVIARSMLVVPNVIDVEIQDANGNDIIYREFTNAGQGIEVELSYNGTVVTPDYANLTVTYTGVQTNGKTYNSTEKPVHAGVYAVTAVYVHREDGQVVAVGIDMATLVIGPAESYIEIGDSIIKHEDKTATNVNIYDELNITAGSKADENLVVDTTIIVGSIASSGDFSENGWNAIEGVVNVDFPRWVDELMGEYAPSIYDGMTVAAFKANMLSALADIKDGIASVEYDSELLTALEEAVAEIIATVEKLPANLSLTFEDMDTYTTYGIGAYVVIGVVTDSDHYPSVDVGILVITPDVDVVHLDWDYKDCNGIWTRELLKIAGITDASAYDDIFHTVPYTDKEVEISYQFIGINADGDLVIYSSAETLANGAFVELAYVEFELAGEIVLSDIIARPMLVVPNTADVDFVDGNDNDLFLREFNNEEQGIDGIIYDVNDDVVTPDANDIWTIRYVGVQTNGKTYNSTVAPVHAGTYSVIAVFVGYDENGNMTHFGAEIGALVITPTTSTLEVTGATVTYNGEAHGVTVKAESAADADLVIDTTVISGTAYPTISGNFSEVGILDALYGNVNIDFPAWFDAYMAEQVVYVNGLSVATLIELVESYRDSAIAAIPVDELLALGVSQEAVDSMISKLEDWASDLISAIDALPDNITLTFEDDMTYTEPGTYLYFGVVTDSDHYASADGAVLTIEKMDALFGAWHTVVPYDGKGHTVYVPNDEYNFPEAPTMDYVTVIVDRVNNHVNLVFDDDLNYLWASVEDILGVELPTEFSIEELKDTYGIGIETFTNVLVNVLDALMSNMEIPTDPKEYSQSSYRDLEIIREILVDIANVETGTIAINGELPVNVGEYEFFLFGYSEYYESVDGSATLFIEPIYITISAENAEKIYGDEDPELKYTIEYYSYKGTEIPNATGEGNYDNPYADDENDVTYNRIYVETVTFNASDLPADFLENVKFVIAREAGEDVGKYDITVTTTVNSSNYVVEENNPAIFTIKPAEVTITVESTTIECNGEEPEPEVTVDVTSGQVTTEELGVVITREEGNEPGKSYLYSVSYNESANYNVVITDNGASLTIKGHTEGEVVVENNVDPDCENEGSYDNVVYCTVCGEELSRETVTVDALGHSKGEVVVENNVAPDCENKGSYDNVVYCTVCDKELSRETVTVDALGHSKGEVVVENNVAPDCENKGSYDNVVYCTVCDKELSRETVTVDALGHSKGEVVVENNIAPDCENEGSYDNVVYCTVCDKELSRETVTVDALGHSKGEVVVENNVAPDCENEGSYDNVVHCTVCDKELSRETVTVDALGHTEEIIPGKAATCTEPGLTEGKKCTVCGVVTDEQEEIPVAGHTAGTAVKENVVEATCTTSGSYDSVVYCSVCDVELSRETVIVSASGHNYNGKDYKDEATYVAPTCQETGYYETVLKCANEGCGVELIRNPVTLPVILHEDTDGDGKCDNELRDGSICGASVCTHKEGDGCVEVLEAVAATCTKTGLTKGLYCTACDQSIKAQETIPALGHQYGTAQLASSKAATCTEAGYKEYVRYCTRDNCGVELDRWTNTIAARGYHVDENDNNLCDDCNAELCTEHKTVIVKQENVKQATCTTDGYYDEVTYCATCNEKLSTKRVEVPASGHVDQNEDMRCDYCGISLCGTSHAWVKGETVEPTCGTSGYTVYTCSACGAIKHDDIEDATGKHEYGETPREYDRNASGHGLICKVCRKWQTWTAHTFTISEDGLTKTCTSCGYQIQRQVFVAEFQQEHISDALVGKGYTNVAKITAAMESTVKTTDSGATIVESVLKDVVLKAYNEEDKTWTKVTGADEFPKDGLTITMDLPANFDSSKHKIYVTHMCEDGSVEIFAVNSGLTIDTTNKTMSFKVSSLSPIGYTVTCAHDWTESYTNNGDGTHTAHYVCSYDSTHTKSDEAVAHTYVSGKCVCGAMETVEETVQYSFGQSYQIRLIEPWGLKANLRVYVADSDESYIDYDKLYDYGVYFIRASDLDANDTITIEDILNDSDAVKYSKGDDHISVVTINGNKVLSAIYDEGLYTYEFSDSVYVLYYVIDKENSEPQYAVIRERNLSKLVNEQKGNTKLSDKEREVYKHMAQLEIDVLAYRAQFENPSDDILNNAPTIANSELQAPATDGVYKFGLTNQIRVIEPWGLKVNARVYTADATPTIDYSDLEDYGVVIWYDVEATYTGTGMTAEELLARKEANVYSGSNGYASIEKLSGASYSVITACYEEGIYTYQLNTNAYVMFFVKADGNYYYSAVKTRNVKTLMENSAATGYEAAVYSDMLNLYEAITEYRKDYV